MNGNWKGLITLLSYAYIVGAILKEKNDNPHQPMTLTWQVLSQSGEILFATSKLEPPGAWWPTLYFCLRQIIPAARITPPNVVRSYGFYSCPEHLKSSWCGGPRWYFCSQWSCVTSNDGDWKWAVEPSGDGLEFSFQNKGPGKRAVMRLYRNQECNPTDLDRVKLQFTNMGKKYALAQWIGGMTWGVVFYNYGSRPGSLLHVRLNIESPPALPVGPNKVLPEPNRPFLPRPAPTLPHTQKTHQMSSPQKNVSSPVLYSIAPEQVELSPTRQRLLGLLQGAFSVLNGTNPNATKSCWLCLTSGPPYYEGMAVMGTYNNTTSHDHCSWGRSHTLTLTEVSGRGTCIGKVPLSHRHLCNVTYESPRTKLTYYLSPGPNKWWACSTGLTPCVSTSVFNDIRDYCILVQLVPRVIYHPSETFVDEFDRRLTRLRREPVTMTLAVLLGVGGIAAGIGTGAVALDSVPRYYNQLRQAMDTDIAALEQSITKLK